MELDWSLLMEYLYRYYWVCSSMQVECLDYMLDHSGVPMQDGHPSSYEMKKVYDKILRSCGNWKHNATIAAQSKKRYI